jgi:hypothetical protein
MQVDDLQKLHNKGVNAKILVNKGLSIHYFVPLREKSPGHRAGALLFNPLYPV